MLEARRWAATLFTFVEDLDAAIGDARPELLFGQRIGHRVIVLGDFHVVVEAGAALFPFGILVGLRGQRFEYRPVKLLEQLPARRAEVPRDPTVEVCQQLSHGLVEFGEAEKTAVPEAGENPTLDNLDGDLDPSS